MSTGTTTPDGLTIATGSLAIVVDVVVDVDVVSEVDDDDSPVVTEIVVVVSAAFPTFVTGAGDSLDMSPLHPDTITASANMRSRLRIVIRLRSSDRGS